MTDGYALGGRPEVSVVLLDRSACQLYCQIREYILAKTLPAEVHRPGWVKDIQYMDNIYVVVTKRCKFNIHFQV